MKDVRCSYVVPAKGRRNNNTLGLLSKGSTGHTSPYNNIVNELAQYVGKAKTQASALGAATPGSRQNY